MDLFSVSLIDCTFADSNPFFDIFCEFTMQFRGHNEFSFFLLNLRTLGCDEVHVTEAKEGESLTRFSIQAGDVARRIEALPIGAACTM
jgi:hypothetical protein